MIATCLAVCALGAPLAAMADSGKGKGSNATASGYVAPDLLDKAKTNPGEKVRVIVTSTYGTSDASSKLRGLGPLSSEKKRLDIVRGVVAELPAALVAKLQGVPGLSVTPDAKMRLAGYGSVQLWPYQSGNASLWRGDATTYSGKMPAIAIVDSGVENRSDFAGKIRASVNLTSLPGNSAGDGRGHGTFVAGVAAGATEYLAGAAPTAPIVSLDVMDDSGTALTSDVISAAQWILDHKGEYNIQVANFSLHSLRPSNFFRDPLDQAVEKLWFNGVVVVAAAGNYGVETGPSGVKYAPGNDPFVITVGALDLGGTTKTSDDVAAPWSAYGHTYDGFAKPELSAAGRYMVGPVPAGSSLTADKPDKVYYGRWMQLSGTSFAAPIVAGTAAQILARHPNWTPDQVKGALMVTARAVFKNPQAAGLGELTASKAVGVVNPPNPNAGLNRFVTSGSDGSGSAFNALAWTDAVASGDLAWSDLAWSDLAWSDSNVASLAWSDLAWSDLAWTDLAWSDLAWTDMAWTDSSTEDAAEGDTLPGEPYTAVATEVAEAQADPALMAPDGTVADPPVGDSLTDVIATP
jgi:serine protease AprX